MVKLRLEQQGAVNVSGFQHAVLVYYSVTIRWYMQVEIFINP